MEREFDLSGRSFKLRKLDAIRQFHIVRKIAPLLSEMIPTIKTLKIDDTQLQKLSEEERLDQFSKIAVPIVSGLSKLSDADADFVLYGLLACVEVKQPIGSWAKVSSGSMLMIQDMELPLLLQLAGRAFMYNLSGFFSELPRPT